MKHIRTDISYCSGVGCPLRESCARYLPEPEADVPLSWVSPQYAAGRCPLMIK